MQTRILKELIELKEKETLAPQGGSVFQTSFLKQFDWTETLLTGREKQAIEDTLVDYHDSLARHRMEIEMNTESKVKLLQKNNSAVYNQNLPMPIHLRSDQVDSLAKWTFMTLWPDTEWKLG